MSQYSGKLYHVVIRKELMLKTILGKEKVNILSLISIANKIIGTWAQTFNFELQKCWIVKNILLCKQMMTFQ